MLLVVVGDSEVVAKVSGQGEEENSSLPQLLPGSVCPASSPIFPVRSHLAHTAHSIYAGCGLGWVGVGCKFRFSSWLSMHLITARISHGRRQTAIIYEIKLHIMHIMHYEHYTVAGEGEKKIEI